MNKLKSSLFAVLLFMFSVKTTRAQYCLDLPPMNGTPSSYVSPNDWSIWNSTPDIISGNGVYPGTTQANITNVNGSSSAGGEMVFFLINGILGQNTEAITTVFTGLVPGTSYFIAVEWQQVTLDYIGVTFDPKGGKLVMYLDGINVGVFSSSGGLNDNWQTATITFVATSSSHVFGLKGELLDNSNRGAIVVDNLPCSIILPVELMDFEVSNVGRDILVSWKTMTEVNSDYFAIERSANTIDWETTATVKSAGSSSVVKHYSHIDEYPFTGTSYYRLKQVDFNGDYEYSEIRSVNFQTGSKSELIVFPNPACETVSISGEEAKNVSITDLSGKSIDLESRIISSTKSQLTLDLSSLSKGVYFVVSRGKTQKLIVK